MQPGRVGRTQGSWWDEGGEMRMEAWDVMGWDELRWEGWNVRDRMGCVVWDGKGWKG